MKGVKFAVERNTVIRHVVWTREVGDVGACRTEELQFRVRQPPRGHNSNGWMDGWVDWYKWMGTWVDGISYPAQN